MKIRTVVPDDIPSMMAIYNYYIRETVVTFEESTISAEEMSRRVDGVLANGLPWLVASDSATVTGYAYASPWNGRSAYQFTVEVTVYLRHGYAGGGVGTMLYSRLFEQLDALGKQHVIGVIALPNEASVGLHEKFGLKKAGEFSEVGRKFDRWIDVGYWYGRIEDKGSVRNARQKRDEG